MRKAVLTLMPVLMLVFAGTASASSPLSGWWRFDEGAGTVTHDSSGRGNAGALSGGATWTPGYFGSALSFDGSAGSVDVPDSPSLEPSSAITVTAWVKAEGPEGDFDYIVAKGATQCMAASYGLYTGADGGLIFYVSRNLGFNYVLSPDAGPGVWDGNWHFVVGTYDGASVRLYVDGKQVGTGSPFTGSIGYGLPNGNDLFFGHYDGCAAHDFDGAIDEPTVWNRALTGPEVSGAYTVLVSLHRLFSRLPYVPGA